MPTPAEKKALLFIGAVAFLGGGVRFWQARHRPSAPARTAVADDDREIEPATHTSSRRSSRHARTDRRHTRRSSSSRSPSRRSPRDDPDEPTDGPATVDLDVATIDEIASLGVVSPGVARMIVEDRDDFGPFGSIYELKRVPYLTRYSIEKLAPRVTFSRLPRPKNAILQGRTPPPAPPSSRRRPKIP